MNDQNFLSATQIAIINRLIDEGRECNVPAHFRTRYENQVGKRVASWRSSTEKAVLIAAGAPVLKVRTTVSQTTRRIAEHRERSAEDGPWCWQNKEVRRRIREAFDATHDVTSALSVYDALTEIASDTGKARFTTTHAWIQRFSGVSVRTIQAHLKAFSDLGLLQISTPKLRAPSTYTLLTFGNGCVTLSNGCTAFGNDASTPSLPTSEEIQKNLKESPEEVGTACKAAAPKRQKPTVCDEAWLTELAADPAFAGLNVALEHAKMVRWCSTNGRMPSRKRFVNWLNRADKPMTFAAGRRSPSEKQLSEEYRKF